MPSPIINLGFASSMLAVTSPRQHSISCHSGRLPLGDVPGVLASYAELAHRYEALLRGVQLMLETSSGAGPQRPTASDEDWQRTRTADAEAGGESDPPEAREQQGVLTD
jgi:hypothetical protein